MAMMRTEAKIAALLSLIALLLLAHALLQPPRPRGPAATALIADHLLSALDLHFDGRRLIGLLTRRNMILLCHAILLVILKDAGLLSTPARRCAEETAASAPAGGGGASCSRPQPQERSIVVWRKKPAKNADLADGGRPLKRGRRSPRPGKVTAPRALPWTEPAAAAAEREEAVVADREIVPVVEVKSSCSSFHYVHNHEERNRGEEEDMAREEAESCNDVEDMNRRFEEFITSTRRKMQLENLQLVKV